MAENGRKMAILRNTEPFALFWEGTKIKPVKADTLSGFAGILFDLQPDFGGDVVIQRLCITTDTQQVITFALYRDNVKVGEYNSPELPANRAMFFRPTDAANKQPILRGAESKKWSIGFEPNQVKGSVMCIGWNGGVPCHTCWQERIDSKLWHARRPYIAWAAPTHDIGAFFHCQISIRLYR